MRHTQIIGIIVALLISACGAQPAAQPAATPGAAPTEAAFLDSNSVPAPSPMPSGATAIAGPPTSAEPTARLILPPGTAAPATDDVAQAALTPTRTPAAQAAAQPSATPAAQAAQPATSAKTSQPVRLAITDIDLDGQVVSVGLDNNRVPIVPKHEVGWYNLSARPGEGDNIVLWGHVLRFREAPKIPAPFARIKELKPGAGVVLYDKDGKPHEYIVTKQVWVTPDQIEYILPKGKEMVTMVSCIGDKIIQGSEVVDESHRLITIAEPAA